MRSRGILWLAGGVALPVLLAQSGKKAAGDWPMYNHDLASTRYSPLNQINTKNVAGLTQAWAFSLAEPNAPARAGRGGRGGGGVSSEATPIVAAGVLYLPAGNRIMALD